MLSDKKKLRAIKLLLHALQTLLKSTTQNWWRFFVARICDFKKWHVCICKKFPLAVKQRRGTHYPPLQCLQWIGDRFRSCLLYRTRILDFHGLRSVGSFYQLFSRLIHWVASANFSLSVANGISDLRQLQSKTLNILSYVPFDKKSFNYSIVLAQSLSSQKIHSQI